MHSCKTKSSPAFVTFCQKVPPSSAQVVALVCELVLNVVSIVSRRKLCAGCGVVSELNWDLTASAEFRQTGDSWRARQTPKYQRFSLLIRRQRRAACSGPSGRHKAPYNQGFYWIFKLRLMMFRIFSKLRSPRRRQETRVTMT